jgi:hypothetical protein
VSTRDEVNEKATLFGWQSHQAPGHPIYTTYVRADKCVQVSYATSGHITEAIRYMFFKLNDLREQERAGSTHKKETVLSWLAT